jgi:ribonuclease BN (tRNA processing enzyme)
MRDFQYKVKRPEGSVCIANGHAQAALEPLCYTFTSCAEFNRPGCASRAALRAEAPTLRELHSVPVEHCPDAWGLVLTVADGPLGPPLTVVYSGDTRPCGRLVRAARERCGSPSVAGAFTHLPSWTCGRLTPCACRAAGAVLLVHEATFWSDEPEHARQKRHSTLVRHAAARWPRLLGVASPRRAWAAAV